VSVTLRRRTTVMTAREVHGEERRVLWDRLLLDLPTIATYQARAGHEIPVIVLSAGVSGGGRP
jgi:hypothetical protein